MDWRRWTTISVVGCVTVVLTACGMAQTHQTCTGLCGNLDKYGGVPACMSVTAAEIVSATGNLVTVVEKGSETGPDGHDYAHRVCTYVATSNSDATSTTTVTVETWIDLGSGAGGPKYNRVRDSYPSGNPPLTKVYPKGADDAFVVGQANALVLTTIGVVVRITNSNHHFTAVTQGVLIQLGSGAEQYITS